MVIGVEAETAMVLFYCLVPLIDLRDARPWLKLDSVFFIHQGTRQWSYQGQRCRWIRFGMIGFRKVQHISGVFDDGVLGTSACA